MMSSRMTFFFSAMVIGLLSTPRQSFAREDVSTTLQISLGNFEPTIGSDIAQDYHNETFDERALEQTVILTRYFPNELIRRNLGQLGLRFQIGQWQVTQDSAKNTGEETSLRVLPLSLGLAYRFDALTQYWSMPFTGYAASGLASYIWYGKGPFREKDQNRSASYEDIDAASGYFVSIGLGLNLDFILRQSYSTGSKSYHTASLLVEWHRTWLNNFKSDTNPGRLDLSTEQWRIGIAIDM